jgi:hypothetical protein
VIDCGGRSFAFPPTHNTPIDSVFSFCSYDRNGGGPVLKALARSTEAEADAARLLQAEVDEAIALCGGDVRAALRATLIANAYLEAEIERLIDTISTGLSRGRRRRSPRRMKIKV